MDGCSHKQNYQANGGAGLLASATSMYLAMMMINMTAFQYNHSFGFQKPMKVKMVK